MAGENKLCYAPSGNLAYKRGDGRLIFKTESFGWTQISFAWDADGKDLDIRAQWSDGGPIVGYGYNSDAGDYSTGVYGLIYSGDIRGSLSSEWVKIKRKPWGGSASSFVVRFNFYGYDESSFPTSVCTVIASQEGGETIVKPNVLCGTHGGDSAAYTDPGVRIDFDGSGKLLSITPISGS